jgi:hypothetical protein
MGRQQTLKLKALGNLASNHPKEVMKPTAPRSSQQNMQVIPLH